MTNAAIAEHIIYLVNEHKQQLEDSVKAFAHSMERYTMLANVIENPDDLKPVKHPISVESAATNLVNRIQAVLENRDRYEKDI